MVMMPELPEVEVIAQEIEAYAGGETIEDIVTLDPTLWEVGSLPPQVLQGARITRVWRRGKFLVFSTGRGDFLLHLRMTGRLLRGSKDGSAALPLRLKILFPEKALWFSDRRRLGKGIIVGHADRFFTEKGWGPEPLPWNFRACSALIRAVQSSRRAIKIQLMDQRVIAGIGNIYADEALHRAGIHPATQGVQLSKEKILHLYQAVVAVLSEALASKGTSIQDYFHLKGSRGGFQKFLKVYGRSGERCSTCHRGRIERIVLSGRSSWYCPRCQKFPPLSRDRMDNHSVIA